MVDCRLPVCAHVQHGGSYECSATVKQCDYDVEYADGSSTMGVLLEDTLTVLLTNGSQSQTKAIIGYILVKLKECSNHRYTDTHRVCF